MISKKSSAGIGILIIFISLLLVVAIASMVLLTNSGKLSNIAMLTGRTTAQKVTDGISIIEIDGLDGPDYFRTFSVMLNLRKGSNPIKLSDLKIQLKLNNRTRLYTFGWPQGPLGEYFLNCTRQVPKVINNTNSETNHTFCTETLGVISCSSHFGFHYLESGYEHMYGYVSTGDVVEICFASPRVINNLETYSLMFLSNHGVLDVKTLQSPNLIMDKKFSLFP